MGMAPYSGLALMFVGMVCIVMPVLVLVVLEFVLVAVMVPLP